MLINTGFIGQEVLMDVKCSGSWAVFGNISHELFGTMELVATHWGLHFVILVVKRSLAGALVLTSGLDTLFFFAVGFAAGHMMLTLRHSVREASSGIAKLATSNNSGAMEPVPRNTDLTSVAAHGTSTSQISSAAGGGVSSR